MSASIRPFDRLSAGEKAPLVRAWQRFSALVQRPVPEGDVRRLRDLVTGADDAEAVARARAAYLWRLEQCWFRIAWAAGSPDPDPHLPEEALEGGSLDELLAELHPANLLDALGKEDAA